MLVLPYHLLHVERSCWRLLDSLAVGRGWHHMLCLELSCTMSEAITSHFIALPPIKSIHVEHIGTLVSFNNLLITEVGP